MASMAGVSLRVDYPVEGEGLSSALQKPRVGTFEGWQGQRQHGGEQRLREGRGDEASAIAS